MTLNKIKWTRPFVLVLHACVPAMAAVAGDQFACLIEPETMAEVGSPVVGVVDSVLVERGDTVRQGQALATLQSEVERAAVDVARSRAESDAEARAAAAALDLAHQHRLRVEGLVKRKLIADEEVDKARAEAKVSEQKLSQAHDGHEISRDELRLAEARLSQRTIRSPITGVLVDRLVSPGERVEEKPMFRVARIDPLRVEIVVPATKFGLVQRSTLARITPDVPGAGTLEAGVSVIDPLIDGASNTFRVRLHLPNPKRDLPAGARCQAVLDLADPARHATEPLKRDPAPSGAVARR